MTYNSSLIKSAALLDCYRTDADEFGIGDFSRFTGQPESTIQRLINTLEFIGIIIQNPNNKKYRLSLRILASSKSARYTPQWLDMAKKELVRLQKETHETVNLGIRMGNELEYIAKVDTDQLLRPNFILGKRYPLYCTGLGRCLLSDLSREDIRELLTDTILAESGRRTPDFTSLYNTVQQTRQQGYYLDDEIQPWALLHCGAGLCLPRQSIGGRQCQCSQGPDYSDWSGRNSQRNTGNDETDFPFLSTAHADESHKLAYEGGRKYGSNEDV